MSYSQLNSIRFSLKDFLFIVFYKIHVIFFVFIIILILSTSYILSLRSIYRTSSYILIKPIIDSRNFPVTGKDFFDVEPVTEIDINTELEILTSRELVLDVIKKLDIKLPLNDAIKYVNSGFEASSVTASSAIRISKEGDNPKNITDIVNTYVECYINRHIEIHRSENEISFYENEVGRKKKEFEDMQLKLIKLIKNYNLIDIEEQKDKNILSITNLNDEVIKLENEIAEKKIIIKSTRELDFNTEIKNFQDSEIIKNINLIAYAPLLAEKLKILSLYSKKSPEYMDMEKSILDISKEIKKEKEKIVNGITIDIESSEMKLINIKKEIKKIKKESQQISEVSELYTNMIAEMKQVREMYVLYLNKLEEERIQTQMETSGFSNISVISRAYIPSKPVFPKKKFMFTISIMAGLLTSVSAGMLFYYIDHTVKRDEDITFSTGLSVLSSLEDVK